MVHLFFGELSMNRKESPALPLFSPHSLRESHPAAYRRPRLPDDSRLVSLAAARLLLGPAFGLDE